MRSIVIDVLDPQRLGELITAARLLGGDPHVLALGQGEVPGRHDQAFICLETLGPNLISGLSEWLKDQGYEAVILSATALGTELAGPLTVRLEGAVVTEVTALSLDQEAVIVEKPMYGGKAVATYRLTARPLVLTVRRKYFEPEALSDATAPKELDLSEERVSLIEEKVDQPAGVPLEEAAVIVTGGRGVGGEKNFGSLYELAGLLQGAVGASRGAVDEGWASPTLQIGQTGKIVAPTIYFAVGVSGASQHLAGIAKAKCVVAINKDEEANIFKRAQFGIVSDYKKIVPGLIEILKEGQ